MLSTELEHSIQTQIMLEFGQRTDMKIWRQNTGVAKTLDGNRFIRFGVVGCADISGIIKGGIRLEIEVKKRTGKQREAQKAFQRMIESMGGIYIVARSVDDVYKVLKTWGFDKPTANKC